MLSRLGLLGIGAAVMAVACVGAAIFQGSVLAMIAAVPAGIYVAVRLFRSSDA